MTVVQVLIIVMCILALSLAAMGLAGERASLSIGVAQWGKGSVIRVMR